MTDLSDESRKTVDEYLRRLGEGLSELPEDERADAVAEARSHIEEAVARIREDETAAVGTVLRGLGEPEAFAEGLLAGNAQKEPAVTAQPAPVARAAAPPAKPRRGACWWLGGCGGALLLVMSWPFVVYLATRSDPPPQTPEAAARAVMARIVAAQSEGDAGAIDDLLHPDFVAEKGITGSDPLLPDEVVELEVSVGHQVQRNRFQCTLTGRKYDEGGQGVVGVVAHVYTLERHSGRWLIRDVREVTQDAAPADEGSPEASEPSQSH